MAKQKSAYAGLIMGAFSLVFLGAAWRVYILTPHTADLYYVVYLDQRHKAEASAMFLLTFPLFCCAISLLQPIHWWMRARRSSTSTGPEVAIPYIVFVLFAFGSIFRTITVARHFGV